MVKRPFFAILTALVLVVGGAAGASGQGPSGAWSEAADLEATSPGADPSFNTDAVEGCPNISRDDRTFFIASDRLGGLGGLDIWMSTRESADDPWGPPVNVGPPVNSTANDFCPTLSSDMKTFFFVSNRPGHCGDVANADIYQTRLRPNGTFRPVTHLGCTVNSGSDEHSPFPVTMRGVGRVLFYSSARAASATDVAGDHDIYTSRRVGGVYQVGELVPGVNTEFQDGQPNVRRDGKELFFYSNRPGALGGSNDIYSSSRTSTSAPWAEPVNLGPEVNSTAAETRPSVSWDGHTLYFGSTRAGSSDVYVTTR